MVPGIMSERCGPRAKLLVLSWRDDAHLEAQLAQTFNVQRSRFNVQRSAFYVLAHTHIPSPESFASVSVIPHDPEAFARALYAELHRADEAQAQCIIIEAVPDSIEWRAIADRLRRASAE